MDNVHNILVRLVDYTQRKLNVISVDTENSNDNHYCCFESHNLISRVIDLLTHKMNVMYLDYYDKSLEKNISTKLFVAYRVNPIYKDEYVLGSSWRVVHAKVNKEDSNNFLNAMNEHNKRLQELVSGNDNYINLCNKFNIILNGVSL